MRQLIGTTVTPRATSYSPALKRRHVPVFNKRIWDGVSRFAMVRVRPMIARLGIASGSFCLAWIVAGSGLAVAQPWQPRDPEPPPNLPAATGLTHADEVAMRLLIEAQIAAIRADDWPSAFALESPDLQAQYGTPAALRDDCPPSALVGQIRQIEEGSVSGSS